MSTAIPNRKGIAAMNGSKAQSRSAFTIIELMVAVAIIALLISIMIPGFSAVRNSAKIVATQALFQGLDHGIEGYRGERALGGTYPPSRTDNANPLEMANPFSTTAGEIVFPISGANLLAYALVGADQLGTPGFLDLDGDGTWNDDQGADYDGTYAGAYALNPLDDARPRNQRYPGGGATYVDETTRASLRSLGQLYDDGVALYAPGETADEVVEAQLFFTDSWGRPILYYRANRAGQSMVTEYGAKTRLGIYDVVDNARLAGAQAAGFLGVDFGPGLLKTAPLNCYSRIGNTLSPGFDPKVAITPDTLEAFIQDPAITAQNRPVNARTYLLISAGVDAIFGTNDDVTNWERAE